MRRAGWRGGVQRSSRNCCVVRPASRTIPPMVTASTGSCLGMVTIRRPSVMTMCLPCLATWKPAFSRALAARRCGIPGIFGIHYAGTSTSLRSSPASCLAISRYSRIASRIFSRASSSVAPCDQQPGSPGQETEYPSSVARRDTGYFIPSTVHPATLLNPIPPNAPSASSDSCNPSADTGPGYKAW